MITRKYWDFEENTGINIQSLLVPVLVAVT